MSVYAPVTTPIGDLEWTIISGEGKESLNGTPKYQSTVVVSAEAAKPLLDQIEKFWQDNRPKSVATPKSTGVKPHQIDTGKVDENTGKKIYQPDGKIAITLSTGTSYKDGKAKKIPVANAKGAIVDLLDKKIGNGSRGLLKGLMSVYEVKTPKGAITDAGVTLYLNSVQLTKFVEYTGGDSFAEVTDTEGDGFEGVNPEFGAVTDNQTSVASTAQTKPRL
jgi:hypothetical protein